MGMPHHEAHASIFFIAAKAEMPTLNALFTTAPETNSLSC